MRHARRSAILASAAILLALTGCASGSSADAETSPSAEATERATQSVEPGVTVESVQIPAGLSPDEFGKTLIEDRLSEWIMAGANDSTAQAIFNRATGTAGEVTDKLAADNAAIFAEALFVPDYKQDQELVDTVNGEAESNSVFLQSWYSTYQTGETVDVEPYRHWITVDSTTVVSQDDSSTTYSINATEHTNEDLNSVGLTNPTDVDGSKFIATVTATEVDGLSKISSLDFQRAQ